MRTYEKRTSKRALARMVESTGPYARFADLAVGELFQFDGEDVVQEKTGQFIYRGLVFAPSAIKCGSVCEFANSNPSVIRVPDIRGMK